MTTTGYTDTFGRTVAGGLGTATSGQAYTLFGTASQFSVAPSVATIAPTTGGDKFGYIDNLASDLDITGQVALTAIPSTNLATVGFVAKLSSISNYYNATMMVATGGAISLRFSKVVSGGLSTIATVSTGLTYVANTFYNLRFAIRWSQRLQTNVLQSKLWAIGATEPGGWMATATDNGLVNYVAGTQVGIMTRDESTVVGSVSGKIQNVVASSYHLPIPSSTDPMCYDPGVAYPKQTALETLADAVDAAMVTLDPYASLAGLFPRVRVSSSNVALPGAFFDALTFAAIEFNVGTTTDLGLDSSGVSLPVGIWLATFEMQLSEAASDFIWVQINGNNLNANTVDMRSNPTHTGDQGVGGTVHMSVPVIVTDPTTPQKVTVSLTPNNNVPYTVTYMALSAIKISDYFA